MLEKSAPSPPSLRTMVNVGESAEKPPMGRRGLQDGGKQSAAEALLRRPNSTHDPVENAKKLRRSSRLNSDMMRRRSRTGRLSIVKPWSALTAFVRPSESRRGQHREHG